MIKIKYIIEGGFLKISFSDFCYYLILNNMVDIKYNYDYLYNKFLNYSLIANYYLPLYLENDFYCEYGLCYEIRRITNCKDPKVTELINHFDSILFVGDRLNIMKYMDIKNIFRLEKLNRIKK